MCYIPNKDAYLSTISLESLFISLIIDTHEGMDVEFFDILGVHPNADTAKDKSIILKLKLNLRTSCVR